MREIAQTNLQLYDQLLGLGWEPADLAHVRDAYELACVLFSGRYRPSGKTFVAHVVGTGSVVAATGGRPALVGAALLHAAYEQGDFGPGAGMDRRRATIRAAIGEDAEQIVLSYASAPWNAETVGNARREVAALSPSARDVLFLRLANEADEHADRGAVVADRQGSALYRGDLVDAMVELAGALGHPPLADLLRRVSTDDGSRPVPAALRSAATGSVLVPPASYRPRLTVAATALRRTLRRRIGRLPGARAAYRRVWSRRPPP